MLRGIHGAVQASLDHPDCHGVAADRARSRRRIEWLERDLAILGVSAPQAAIPDLVLRTVPEALGCLYVVEGSALGGQHIARIVGRDLGLNEANGARYFFGYGKETDVTWAAFVARLDAFPATMAAGVEHGARLTFMLFDTAFTHATAI